MTRTNNRQAKHVNQNAARGRGQKRRVAVVALAIAGVLAVGGASAVCVAGLGKSPGQAPAAAQTASAQKAAPAKAATPAKAAPAKATPAKAETQQAAKPEAQPVQKQQTQQAKPAQQPAKQQAKPQQAQQAQQQAQPLAAPAPRQAEQNSGLEAKVSREQCIAIACAHVGAGGAAKGEAKNVTAKGPITGGGTVYYAVELDLGDVHYSVTVDAIEGNVISSDQTHAGTRVLLDESGNPIDGTEQPVSA